MAMTMTPSLNGLATLAPMMGVGMGMIIGKVLRSDRGN